MLFYTYLYLLYNLCIILLLLLYIYCERGRLCIASEYGILKVINGIGSSRMRVYVARTSSSCV